MSIQYAILGLLSRGPLTGYDLKKLFADSEVLYWSGNSNQIYRALVDLHNDDLVSRSVEDQQSGPSRKVYTITAQGLAALRAWVLSPPELPQLRHPFLVQLAWADHVTPDELDGLLAAYAEELRVRVLMLREQAQRDADRLAGEVAGPRAAHLWDAIGAHWLSFYEREVAWVTALRGGLAEKGDGS